MKNQLTIYSWMVSLNVVNTKNDFYKQAEIKKNPTNKSKIANELTEFC